LDDDREFRDLTRYADYLSKLDGRETTKLNNLLVQTEKVTDRMRQSDYGKSLT